MKRLTLLILTNFVIIGSLSFIGYKLDLHIWLSKIGINYKMLLAFSTLWGFGIAFLSLFMSKFVAKWFLRLQMINPKKKELSYFEEKLYGTVVNVSKKAGIKTPEIGIYKSKELNAFATGWSKNHSLIAFTSNVFDHMDWEEIEGVIAHEVSHIVNGDMVSLTLLQGLNNAFSMFLSRLLSFTVINSIFGEKGKMFFFTYHIYTYTILFFETIFFFLGSIVTNYYSRKREYSADALAANLVGKRKMIKALYCLMKFEDYEEYNLQMRDKMFNSFKICNFSKTSIFGLFDTHPPLSKRIKRVSQLDVSEDQDSMEFKNNKEIVDLI